MTRQQRKDLKKGHKAVMSSYRTLPFYNKGFYRCILRIIIFVLWCFIWLDSGTRIQTKSYTTYEFADMQTIIILTLISIVGFVVFRPHKIFTDRTYCGIIEGIEKQHAETAKKDKNGTKVVEKKLTRIVYNGTNVLTIRKPSGLTIKRRVPNLAKFDLIYDIDTPVSVINGVTFPVPMKKETIPKGTVMCTKCGSFEVERRTRCSMCFYSLWYK